MNFRALFFDIKRKTNEMLYAYNDVDFMKRPHVNIRAIAKKYGIIKISRMPSEKIPEKHATLEKDVIKLNKNDTPEEQRFSIAHELEHFIKRKANRYKYKAINGNFEITKILGKRNVIQAGYDVEEAAARSNYGETRKFLEKNNYFCKMADAIAKHASINFGKRIPTDKAFNSIAKLIRNGNIMLDNQFILKAADDLYNEEIADYFATNLLVPLERFVLWEDESDKKIADAFKVPVKCIKKRREEIKLELEFLA
jgi:Zn-dependent peptidase ImmA (M78 family)